MELFLLEGLDLTLIVVERRMCCGLGKCGHCRIKDRYVCLDGPVFNYIESKDMLD